MDKAIRYSEPWTLLVQPGFRSLIDKAALSAGAKPNEWARSALAEALRAAGIDPSPKPSPAAGALYDSRIERGQPQHRYAWVEGGEIKAMSYSDAKPSDEWLPVVHVDSEPFDIAAHWRLAPITTVEADRVVVTFPVIAKSLENA